MKNMILSFLNWAKGFVSESKGNASSKRLVGVACAGFLCYTMYANHTVEHEPSEALVYAVASLAFASLGLTSAEKIFKKKEEEPKTEE
jgi:hypothetical protein